jgi:apolipoprotein N-acyltransferase
VASTLVDYQRGEQHSTQAIAYRRDVRAWLCAVGGGKRGDGVLIVREQPCSLVLSSVAWAEDFLFAGTSALLLLVAALWPTWWYLAFLAFIPFLHRVVSSTPTQAIRLGFLFGASYLAVSLIGPLYVSPGESLPRLILGTSVLAGFGWSVASAQRRWGFNPLTTALLWVGFELILIKSGFAHGFFAGMEIGSGFLAKAAVLFGFLTISFVIVLINAILVLAIETAIAAAQARGAVYPKSERSWDPFLIPGLAKQVAYSFHQGRAPPLHI